MKIHVLKVKLRKLHKYIGFTFSLFILHLTVTGTLLTYPHTFKIENTYIHNYYILKKYNMDTYKDVRQFENGDDTIIIIKNNVYLDEKFIDKFQENILGAIYNRNNKKLYILTKKVITVYIFEEINEIKEIKDILVIENSYDLNKVGIYQTNNEIVFNQNKKYFKIDKGDVMKISEIINDEYNLNWMTISVPSKILAKKYLRLHQGNGVSMTRILTELHNGKFFGSIFTLILFISSLSLVFLTLSSFIFATNLFKNKKR